MSNGNPRKLTVPHFYHNIKLDCADCDGLQWQESIGEQERERDDIHDIKGWLYKSTYRCRNVDCNRHTKFSIFVPDEGHKIPQ